MPIAGKLTKVPLGKRDLLTPMTTWPNTRYSLLARLADASDGDAWQAFQSIYQPAIYRYARHRGLQEADALEVVQEVLAAVHRAMDGWKPTHRAGSFRAWLGEAARRLTLQVMRQRDKRDRATGGSSAPIALELLETPALPTQDDEDSQRWKFFCAAGCVENEVHEATWRAFWLTAVEGKSAAAAASELGWTVGNVYSAKCRVLNRIRRRVEELSEDEA
jgi:RNA polymerase sigma-70 factor (ECF subfamily)